MITRDIILKTIDNAILKCKPNPYVLHRKDKEYIAKFILERFKEDLQHKQHEDNMEELEQNQFDEQKNNVDLTEIETRELIRYSDINYEFINDEIYHDKEFRELVRKGLVEEGNDLSLSAKRLNRAINKSTGLLVDTVLYRGGHWDARLIEGSLGVWEGFTSTSFQRHDAEDFEIRDNRRLMKIYAPQGYKGLCINKYNKLSYHQEHEFLLGTGVRFYVLSTSKEEVELLILPN